MLKKSKSIVALGLITLLSSCQSIPQTELSDQITAQNIKSTNLSERALQGWKAHLTDVRSKGSLQKGCDPYYKLAKGQVKGSVMLFHGYSACPQQYDEISNMLSAKGYNVFVPLLPGHGRVATKENDKFVDESSGLPDVDSINVYKTYAKTMGAMLKDEQGVKIVGGLSVGGAIATRAMIDNPDVYNRGFLMAPFFNAAGPISILIPVVDAVIPNKKIDWGKECEEQRKLGRAGYCNFKLTNIAAVRKFGLETLKEVNKIKIPVQITGVEKDPAASNSAIAEASRKLSNSQTCLFAKGANHSMLSPQDNVGRNMFWLKPLEEQLVNYVDTGKNFEVVGKSEHDLSLCRSY